LYDCSNGFYGQDVSNILSRSTGPRDDGTALNRIALYVYMKRI
jgi:hypothetical protein